MSADPAKQRGNVTTCINSVSQVTNRNRAEPKPIPTLRILTVFWRSHPAQKRKTAPERSGSGLQFENISKIVLADLPSDVNNQNTFSVNGGALSGL